MTYKWDDAVASVYGATLNNNLFFLLQKNRFIPQGTGFVRKGTFLSLRKTKTRIYWQEPEYIVNDQWERFSRACHALSKFSL